MNTAAWAAVERPLLCGCGRTLHECSWRLARVQRGCGRLWRVPLALRSTPLSKHDQPRKTGASGCNILEIQAKVDEREFAAHIAA